MADRLDTATEPEDAQTVVDDLAAPDQAQPSAPEAAPEPEAAEPKAEAPPKFYTDDKRDEIYEKIEAKKAAANKDFTGDANDPELIYGREAASGGEGDPEIEALERETMQRAKDVAAQELAEATGEPAGEPPAQPSGPMVKVKVDGREWEIPASDLPHPDLPLSARVNIYQMNSAADRRLAEAREIVERAKQFASLPQAQPGTPTGPSADHSAAQRQGDGGNTQPDQADLDALYERVVETMQLGDTAEAKEALRELVSSIATPQSSQEIAATAAFQVRMDEEHRRSETALREFMGKNEAIATNPHLQAVGLNFLDQEMVADFQAAGASPENIAARIQSPADIRALHRAGRAMGVHGFRPLSDILPVALDKTQGWLAQSAGAVRPVTQPANTNDRMARVQRVAPQPAQRAGPPARPAPPRETVASIVEETRRMRGLA